MTTRRLFFILVAILLMFSFVYIFLINITVRNIVEYGTLKNQNAALTLNVDSMQSTYISQKSALSLSVAYNDGYQNVASPQFISTAAIPNASFAVKYP